MKTNGDLPTIDLNALVAPVARVTLDGTTYDVLPIQGDAMDVLEQVAAEKRERLAAQGSETDEEKLVSASRHLEFARRVVFAVAPSMPKKRVQTMTIMQLLAIAELAADPVRRVREVIEKAEGKGGGPVRRGTRTTSGRK